MAWKLTLEDINAYKASFHLFDLDGNGRLAKNELSQLMRSLGQNFSNADLKEIFTLHGNENNELEFHEFLDLMAEHRQVECDKSKIISAFMYFDRDNTGYISYDEFKHALTSIAEKLSYDEITKFEEEIVNDTEGRFQYKNLVNKMFFN